MSSPHVTSTPPDPLAGLSNEDLEYFASHRQGVMERQREFWDQTTKRQLELEENRRQHRLQVQQQQAAIQDKHAQPHLPQQGSQGAMSRIEWLKSLFPRGGYKCRMNHNHSSKGEAEDCNRFTGQSSFSYSSPSHDMKVQWDQQAGTYRKVVETRRMNESGQVEIDTHEMEFSATGKPSN